MARDAGTLRGRTRLVMSFELELRVQLSYLVQGNVVVFFLSITFNLLPVTHQRLSALSKQQAFDTMVDGFLIK